MTNTNDTFDTKKWNKSEKLKKKSFIENQANENKTLIFDTKFPFFFKYSTDKRKESPHGNDTQWEMTSINVNVFCFDFSIELIVNRLVLFLFFNRALFARFYIDLMLLYAIHNRHFRSLSHSFSLSAPLLHRSIHTLIIELKYFRIAIHAETTDRMFRWNSFLFLYRWCH